MKKFNSNRIILYITIQIILYGTFVTLDFMGSNVEVSNYLKFITIILCFLCVVFLGNTKEIKLRYCFVLGLLFTLISDYFILLKDRYFIGVITFVIVQQCYAILLYLKMYKEKQKWYQSLRYHFIRISLQLILTIMLTFIVLYQDVPLESLIIITIFYFINIVTNVISSIRIAWVKSERNNVLFSLGMILFLLCDINVGLYNLNGFITLNEKVYALIFSLSSLLMWIFYAPSQVLISLSSVE